MPTIDKYQIISQIGSGSYGEVFRVLDRALQAEKAIKVLAVTDPALFMASLEEAQILNRCRHKHIVAINEANIFPVAGSPRVVLDLELVPEGSLESALYNRWVSLRDAVSALRGALSGLEHAHNHGFLHRDIKPGNILLGSQASKLSDFGLATSPGSTLVGSARGYITHLPPEYFVTGTTTVLSDIFAAGMTLFRAVSNIKAWHDLLNSVPNVQSVIQRGELVQHFGFEGFIPLSIRRVIKTACHPDPTKRFQTAKEFRQELDRIRFHIDWIRNDINNWSGLLDGVSYAMSIDPVHFGITFTKKGRRVKALCTKHTSLAHATELLESIVAESTVRALAH